MTSFSTSRMGTSSFFSSIFSFAYCVTLLLLFLSSNVSSLLTYSDSLICILKLPQILGMPIVLCVASTDFFSFAHFPMSFLIFLVDWSSLGSMKEVVVLSVGSLDILVVEVSPKTLHARNFCHPPLLFTLASQFCIPALLEDSKFKLHSPTLRWWWLWYAVGDRFLSALHQAEGYLFAFSQHW